MIISKDEFCNIISRLQKYDELQKKINDLFEEQIDNGEKDFCNAASICIGHESIVVNLLDTMFETDTISWWIYEEHYGMDFKIGDIVEENGDKPDLSTSEKTYEYLVENMLKGVNKEL